jgi:hypothetical protein
MVGILSFMLLVFFFNGGQISRAASDTFFSLKMKIYLRSSYKTERLRYVPQHAIKIHAGFCGLLTKFYLSKVVQRWTMKQGGNLHVSYVGTVVQHTAISK